mmetsp:Transcript_3169/g.8186  ORF Transcript_3169/g.8186 Transcript_3169/m.8186 type:complete len:178 (+) Transcript_3169:17-550(+)|eukprot:CAMPEP_0197426896 /NCGR_PEP_ID=MMETSP1170-20131217/36590_1 /TAXON_ID=54406 /ORGANISM="Sarcinochrysis sp, Strain CCMP770" /LENGTH=177 /DNA_ID=CAMNT_0042954565 /DNA_START=17 /DNA_END=550 /DNA_ORIENTATION=+
MALASLLVVVAAALSRAAGLAAPSKLPVKVVQRQEFLSWLACVAPVAAASAAPGALYPATQLVDELEDLREDVRRGKISTATKVLTAKERTLVPLRTAMEKNPLNDDAAKLQPLLMKGHMLELDEALASAEGFKPYTSKTTGDTYPGGKVERELEEAVETARDYCGLVDCDTLLIYR